MRGLEERALNGTLSTLIFVPLLAFLIYRRVRRSFGQQRIRPRVMIARMFILTAFCILFLTWLPTLQGALFGLAGASVGVVLAYFGLQHTRYESTAAGDFYTPNRWIGVTVLALFFGRLGARIFSVYETAKIEGAPPAGFQRSPFTLGLYFLLAAYYIGYYAGVLRHAPNRETASVDTP
jgi:hypothetical protein